MREFCIKCLQAKITCICPHVRPFDSKVEFVILIHPIEMRRRIATGRMSHLCLENSHLIRGHDYTRHEYVNDILADTNRYNVILYPGPTSINLSPLKAEERAALFLKDKKLTIFVIDGTWETARKMMRDSRNLHGLPRVCFSPERPSNFRIRKQPRPECVSTIEAIHQTIELVGPSQGFDVAARTHDRLLYVFDKMVEVQLEYLRRSRENGFPSRYRRAREVAEL